MLSERINRWIVGERFEKNREIRIDFRQFWLLPIFFILIALDVFLNSSLFMVGWLTIGSTILLSAFWIRQMAKHVNASRQLDYSAFQVGDEMQETITVINDALFPVTYFEITDHSNIPSYQINSVRGIGGLSRLTWKSGAICEQRGVYRLGPFQIQMSDPFGLFVLSKTYSDPLEVLVYPPLCQLKAPVLRQRFARGDRSSSRLPLASDTNNVYATRDYQVGDAVKFIHWPTTARRSRLSVKQFQPESASRIWILADVNQHVHPGQGPTSSLERMVIYITTLAYHLLEVGYTVGLYWGSGPGQFVKPGKGLAYFWDLLRCAAFIQRNDQPLKVVIEASQRIIPDRETLIIVTPSSSLAWVDQTVGHRLNQNLQTILFDTSSLGDSQLIANMSAHLRGVGIGISVVRAEDIQPVYGALGSVRRWKFKVLGTGRVVVEETPRFTRLDKVVS